MAAEISLPVRTETGMEFVNHDGTRLTGDLYRPEGGGNWDLVTVILTDRACCGRVQVLPRITSLAALQVKKEFSAVPRPARGHHD